MASEGPSAGPAVTSRVVRSVSQFAAMADDWDALAARFESPLLRHDWFLSCAEACHGEGDLAVVAVYQHGRLIAAAPLARARQGLTVRLEFLGMAVLQEPAGLLYESKQALAHLAQALVALGPPVVLARLDAGGPIEAAMRAAVGRRGLVVVRQTWPALRVRVSGDWDAYQRTLSSRLTSNVPRLRKRAARLGAVVTEVLAPADGDVEALLRTVMDVEGSGWKGRQGSALRNRTMLRGFVERYAHRAARSGRLRVALLRIGDRVAAVELAVEDFQRWWQLKIGFADDFAELYPGLQLTHETVRHAFERRLLGYEFLGSAAEWERRWNPEERAFELCVTYPATLAGGLGLATDVANKIWGRLDGFIRRPRA